MKRGILVLVLAVMAVSLVQLPASALLANGGFETGDFYGWTTFTTGGGFAEVIPKDPEDTVPYELPYDYIPYYSMQIGDPYFAVLGTGEPGSFVTLRQNVELGVGDILTGLAVLGANTGHGCLCVKILKDNGDYLKTLVETNMAGTPWFQWDYTSIISGKYILELSIDNDIGGHSYALFDANYHISSCPPVPEPASMLLFGTGLLGLVGLRKKDKR